MKAKQPINKPFFTNNARRMAGLPTRRKTTTGKRYKTRCEAVESIAAFLDYCNGKNTCSYHR